LSSTPTVMKAAFGDRHDHEHTRRAARHERQGRGGGKRYGPRIADQVRAVRRTYRFSSAER
jgi:hypothetical protein